MAENPFTETPQIDRALIARSKPQIINGAGWFWWIAGLSVVNTLMVHSGSDTNFVIGLGFTLITDYVFKEVKLLAYLIDLIAIGTFFGLGFFARKGWLWAFVTGIILYSLDSLIYLFLQSWMSVGFHGFALFYLIRGAITLRKSLQLAATPPPAIATPPVVNA